MADKPDPIQQAMTDPHRASSDGQSVQTHSLRDLIAADKYLENKKARGKMGMRLTALVPPGGPGV